MEEGSTISKMRHGATVTLLLPEQAKVGDSTATGDAAARSDSKMCVTSSVTPNERRF